jgi:hypothetical protein
VPPPVHLLDEVAQHPLGDVEVGDDAVLQWPDRDDVARGPADHPFGFDTHGHDLAVVGVERDDGGLVEHDPPAPHVHKRVGGTEVHRHVAAENRHRVTHGEGNLPGRALQSFLGQLTH